FNTEEVAVDSALVAIVPTHDLHSAFGTAHTERRLAPISTVRADGTHMVHLPGTRLIAVGSGRKRADRADVDTHATLFALEMILMVRSDERGYAAVLDTQRPHVHSFATDTYAAIAKNAAWSIEENHR